MFDLFKRAPTDERRSWGERLRAGLEASRQRIAQPLAALMGRKELSEEALGALETALLSADVGVATTERLLADLRSRWLRAGANVDPRALLKASLAGLLAPLEKPFVVGPERPFVIMLAGVNGAGKTTSIGKLARSLQMQGRSVLLAAGDTFRAAARAASGVGRAQSRPGDRSAGRGPGSGDVRCDRGCPRARRGHRARRHRGPPAHPSAPDGGAQENPPRDRQGPRRGTARDAARAGREHGAERARSGGSVRRSAGVDRARSDEARRQRQGGRGRGHRWNLSGAPGAIKRPW